MTTLCKKLFSKFKKQKSYIRFYTLESGTLDLFPIVHSSSVKRNFLTEPDPEGILSSKSCPGIRKLISSGWIVTAPADFIIQTNGDGVSFEWLEPFRFTKVSEGRDSYISSHLKEQTLPLLNDPLTTLHTVVKVETPWRVEASDDIVLLQLPVPYVNESRFESATGILDTKYGHVLNIQLFWKDLNSRTLVRAGTPLCQLIPMSRKQLSPSYYDVSIENATETDKQKERSFNYAANCVVLKHDSLSSRLWRSIKILNKYRKGV